MANDDLVIEITVRLEGLSGRFDQGAGILFNLKPNGDYLTICANYLENNLVLLKFEKGKRSSVKWYAIRRSRPGSGTNSRFALAASRSRVYRRQALS